MEKTFKFRITEVVEKELEKDNETITKYVVYVLEQKRGLFWKRLWGSYDYDEDSLDEDSLDWCCGYFNTIEKAKERAQWEVDQWIRRVKVKQKKDDLKTTVNIISNFEIKGKV